MRAVPRGSRVVVSVKSPRREYAIEFLDVLVMEHEMTWKSQQQQSMSDSMRKLEEELALTEEKIIIAQDSL